VRDRHGVIDSSGESLRQVPTTAIGIGRFFKKHPFPHIMWAVAQHVFLMYRSTNWKPTVAHRIRKLALTGAPGRFVPMWPRTCILEGLVFMIRAFWLSPDTASA